jgi:hypothetical protein
VIEELVKEKKLGNFEIVTYIQFVLDKSVFLEKSKILPSAIPEGSNALEKISKTILDLQL